jgi:murein DD-endopeptidase MepM/ murein hydrolase activator NlpD
MNSASKIFQVLQAVAILIIMTTAAQAYEIADTFQNPMASYVINNYDIDGGNNRFGVFLPSLGLYHSGEDLKANPLTPVYAIANGKVAQSQVGAKGYGQVVVLEHTLPDGNKIISIYGHLSKEKGYEMIKLDPTGKEVTVIKGQRIGYTGYKYEIVEGEPHLHFGIKKGKYAGYYEGRIDLAGLANFHKPSDFLNLIRTVNTNDVYRLSNLGLRTKIQSASAFDSCQWNWDDIRPVSSTEMNRHSTFNAQSACFAPGTFIKRAFSPEISIIKSYTADKPKPNLYRQPFGSFDAFIRAGGKSDLSNVRIVSDTQYKWHVQGATIS